MSRKIINLIVIGTLFTLQSFGQDLNANAKKYFSGYLTNVKFFELISRIMATPQDCRFVFNEPGASTYSNWAIQNKSLYSRKPDSAIVYEDVRIESFLTEDVMAGKNNYNDGMTKIKAYLKPGTRFYEVMYLKKKGDAEGPSYKYFVNLNGKWVVFPRPWLAFE